MFNKNFRTTNVALLRTMATSSANNFATMRIRHDLLEIENSTIPITGVSAYPLDDNLFEWHGNLEGPKNTPYEDMVIHISISIPENYPKSPPKIKILTPIDHPNVFGNELCLDILQESPKDNPKSGGTIGWTSAYTIQSLLLQLQSFLFEATHYKIQKFIEKIKMQKDNVNSFKC